MSNSKQTKEIGAHADVVLLDGKFSPGHNSTALVLKDVVEMVTPRGGGAWTVLLESGEQLHLQGSASAIEMLEMFFLGSNEARVRALYALCDKLVNPSAVKGIQKLADGYVLHFRSRSLRIATQKPNACYDIAALLFGEECAKPFFVVPEAPKAPREEPFRRLSMETFAKHEAERYASMKPKTPLVLYPPITAVDPASRVAQIRTVFDSLESELGCTQYEVLWEHEAYRRPAQAADAARDEMRSLLSGLNASSLEELTPLIEQKASSIREKLHALPKKPEFVAGLISRWERHLTRLESISLADVKSTMFETQVA